MIGNWRNKWVNRRRRQGRGNVLAEGESLAFLELGELARVLNSKKTKREISKIGE